MGLSKIAYDGHMGVQNVKAAAKHRQMGMEFTGGVKTCHRMFPKEEMQSCLADSPSGSHAVATATVSNVKLIATGYKYNRRKVRVCVFMCVHAHA